MGATVWSYFIPYQSDIPRAFHELRWEVFKSGNYVKRTFPDPGTYTFDQFKGNRNDLSQRDIEALKEAYNQYIDRLSVIPDTPDALLQKYGYEGTHSIIDIPEISVEYNPLKSGPLKDEDLYNLFGTIKPSHDMVEKHQDNIRALRGSWYCTYIVVYEDDNPVELFFTGYSGD